MTDDITLDLLEQFDLNAGSALMLNLDPDNLALIDNQEDEYEDY